MVEFILKLVVFINEALWLFALLWYAKNENWTVNYKFGPTALAFQFVYFFIILTILGFL